MIITLKGANFSTSNIGTLSSWRINQSIGDGAIYEGPTTVEKGAPLTATITITEGFKLGAAGVSIIMGGSAISAFVINEQIITINITEVTGNVIIRVPTINISSTHTHIYQTEILKQASCSEEGLKSHTCACGHTYTSIISTLPHIYVKGTCSVCGAKDPNYVAPAVASITAIYNGGDVASNALVEDLRSDIMVYTIYSDGSSTQISSSEYSLSGTISEGANTITIEYEGFTTTISVTGVIKLTQLIAMYDGTAMDIGNNINDITGLSVMGIYSNGNTELINDYQLISVSNTVVEGDNSITIAYDDLTAVIHVNGVGYIDPNVVDLVLFTGQSNMSGRGTAADAPVVPTGQGYWFKDTGLTNMSKDTTGLYDIKEPFGLETLCTGSMVSQFALSYYKQTRCPIVACAGAIGGMDLSYFLKGGGQIYSNYITSSVRGAKNYLESIGKTVRRAFVVFNQGENDAQHNNTKEKYIESFNQFWSDLKSDFGFENMFIIGIGQYNGTSEIDFTNVKQAHLELSQNNSDITFVSDKFTGATPYMRDEWHYTQVVYNAVGKNAATNIANYYNGVIPTITQFTGLDTSIEPIASVGSLDGWDYEITGGTVKLKQYIGTSTDVFVHAYYALDGQIYRALVSKVETKTTSGTLVPVDGTVSVFAKNTTITSVTFEDNVEIEGNNAGCMFYGCTALKRIENIPNAAGGSASLCYGCTALQSYPTFAKYASTLNQAFRNCSNLVADATTITFPTGSVKYGNMFRDCKKVTSAPNIPDTAEEITAMYQGCTGLITAGDIGLGKGTLCTSVFYGCTGLKSVGRVFGNTVTSIASLFQNCKALEGTIRIECPNITNATNAFSNVDLTKVIIQVPTGSTTHTTITTAYPSAVIETF